jgi:hypothetical protein
MVTEYINGKVVIFIKDTIKMEKKMDMESFTGLMEQYIKVNGKIIKDVFRMFISII